MKITRPYTACKANRIARYQNKMMVSRINRPLTAKSDSLKKIIQVIEKTLSKGAQTILNKSKSLEKFTKNKNQSIESSRIKMIRDISRRQRDIPQYRTQFVIRNNSIEGKQSSPTAKTTKKIFNSFCDDDFIPYMKQEGNFRSDPQQLLKKQRPPIKKVTRKRKTMKQCQKQNENVAQSNQIDQWKNDPSLLHLSYLLDQQRR